MSYCDFNPRLFKEFISMKQKIKPAMSNDWIMVPKKHVSIGGFSLRSEKLNQEVADIDLMRFLQFCEEQKLTIEALKLKGNFIIGNDRSVYTEDMFNQWKEKFEQRTEVIIEKKDWIPGNIYKTPCGAEVKYLGARYVANFKVKDGAITFTKVTKKHFQKEPYCSRICTVTQKFTKIVGTFKDNIEDIFEKAYNRDTSFVYMSKENAPSDIQFGLVEVPKEEFKYSEDSYGTNDKNKYGYIPVIKNAQTEEFICYNRNLGNFTIYSDKDVVNVYNDTILLDNKLQKGPKGWGGRTVQFSGLYRFGEIK